MRMVEFIMPGTRIPVGLCCLFVALAFVIAAFAGAAPCLSADTYTSVMPGVTHVHRTTSEPWDIHVLIVDLTNPAVRLRVAIKHDNDKADYGETVRSMCLRYDAAAAVNTDFWGGGTVTHCPQGHCMTDGLTMLPPGYSTPINPNRTTMMIPADNSYGYINKVTSPLPWWFNVAAGGPRLIRNGVVGWESEPDIPSQTVRAPRTGAAISQDWHTLILATCDGRQTSSVGMTGDEMGYLLHEFGGYQGMAFDGGGSTTMVIDGVTVNSPSDGSDRPVAACLMVLNNLDQGQNPTLHYETGFENPPFDTSTLGGTSGWVGGGAVVSGGIDGGQCAQFSGNSAYRNVTTSNQQGVQWVECWVKASSTAANAAVYTGTNNASSTAAQIRLNSSGKIEALDGDGSGGGVWSELCSFSADTWYRLHIRLDYELDSYQSFVDGALLASGFGFKDSGAGTGFRAVRFEQSGGGCSFYVDNVYASNVDPDYLRVSPDTALVVAGGRKQFNDIGGDPPANWSVIDERDAGGNPASPGSVAQIDSSGVLTAISAGTCTVRAQDSIGRTDVSSDVSIIAGQSILDAKAVPDGSAAALSGLIVTAVFDGCVYVEQSDRLAGIKIISSWQVSQGDEVYVVGATDTVDGERCINASLLEVSP